MFGSLSLHAQMAGARVLGRLLLGCIVAGLLTLAYTTARAQDVPITEYDAEAGDWGYEPQDWWVTSDAANGEDGGGSTPGETEPGTQLPPETEPACLEKVESTFIKIVYLSCTTPWAKPGVQKCWKYRDMYTYVAPAGRTSPCEKGWSQIRYTCNPACMEPVAPLSPAPNPGDW